LISDNMTSKVKSSASRKKQTGSLTIVAYETLKDEILSNRLRPGDPLPIDSYIRKLGLSRTPLREAVLRLEREGLVEIRPRMGTFVSHLNLQEIKETYQVRSSLEGLAARLSAARINLERVTEVEQQLKQFKLDGTEDYTQISEAGQQLHSLIIESCGNQMLISLIQSLQDRFRRFRTLSLDIPEKIITSHREHLQILQALKDKNAELAERLVREHFDQAATSLLSNLLDSSSSNQVHLVRN
jgi:DNA-binding GntR family transcriptional regulator